MNNEPVPELDQWLQLHGGDVHRLHHAFSDAVCFAELLSNIFPQLLQPRNFFNCDALRIKYNNWKLINLRVLCKLGLKQPVSMLRDLALGTPGAMEQLLLDLMLKTEALASAVKQKNKNCLCRNQQIDMKQLKRVQFKHTNSKTEIRRMQRNRKIAERC